VERKGKREKGKGKREKGKGKREKGKGKREKGKGKKGRREGPGVAPTSGTVLDNQYQNDQSPTNQPVHDEAGKPRTQNSQLRSVTTKTTKFYFPLLQ
jgi:hypothetical protein